MLRGRVWARAAERGCLSTTAGLAVGRDLTGDGCEVPILQDAETGDPGFGVAGRLADDWQTGHMPEV